MRDRRRETRTERMGEKEQREREKQFQRALGDMLDDKMKSF